MEEFSLNNGYLVDNELLDAQHRVIVDYMANVYSYLVAGKRGKELFDSVDRLDTYCKLHFLDEEKAMEEMEFPRISDHKAQHALFVTHLESFMGRCEELDSVKCVDELLFLKRWFLEHIEACDKQYANHMNR
jgi:hemerythrin